MKSVISFSLLLFVVQTTSAARPNVLFVISDDLGAQSLGCYGNKQCKTPNIDRLARQGIQFQNAYTQYPVCGPSRAALMSGLYAQTIGVTNNGRSRQFTRNLGNRASMSQWFKQRGYYTARVSKIYHMRVPGDITAGVNGPDHAPSWTERFNCKAPEQWSIGKHEHLTKERLKPDPDRSIHYGLGYGTAFYAVRVKGSGAEQADHLAVEKANALLEQRAKDKTPFFLAVGLVRPHVPLVAPSSFFDDYTPAELDLPNNPKNDRADIPRAGLSKSSRRIGLTTKRKKQRVLEAYYASVAYMDAQVGKLLRKLKQLGLAGNTIVVFTADHGYHLGEHDLWQKLSLHEESTRIPLIIRMPGRMPSETAALAQQIDIYPTLAALAGLPAPKRIQGKSLLPVIDDPKAVVHKEVYCLRGRNDHLLRTPNWALIRYGRGRGGVELYDMKNDSKQHTNLAQDEKHRPTLRRLQQRLTAKLKEIRAYK